MYGLLRSERLLKALSEPIVMMAWYPVYSEVEEYIILTITAVEEMMKAFYHIVLWPLPLVHRAAHILGGPGFLSSGASPI